MMINVFYDWVSFLICPGICLNVKQVMWLIFGIFSSLINYIRCYLFTLGKWNQQWGVGVIFSSLLQLLKRLNQQPAPNHSISWVFVFTTSSGFILGDEPCISLNIPEATAGTYCSFLTSPIKTVSGWGVRTFPRWLRPLMHANMLHYNGISHQQYERERCSQKERERERVEGLNVCLCPTVN